MPIFFYLQDTFIFGHSTYTGSRQGECKASRCMTLIWPPIIIITEYTGTVSLHQSAEEPALVFPTHTYRPLTTHSNNINVREHLPLIIQIHTDSHAHCGPGPWIAGDRKILIRKTWLIVWIRETLLPHQMLQDCDKEFIDSQEKHLSFINMVPPRWPLHLCEGLTAAFPDVQ